ncbi:hypothetical protein CW705_08110 [Candidatus Bathyarchaeota archaeon]|nr:MAG: hypothetical protein CW705_08110 [Candidatus Bathyarchaeota archaeon]
MGLIRLKETKRDIQGHLKIKNQTQNTKTKKKTKDQEIKIFRGTEENTRNGYKSIDNVPLYDLVF